jgi:hypothetical protein
LLYISGLGLLLFRRLIVFGHVRPPSLVKCLQY